MWSSVGEGRSSGHDQLGWALMARITIQLVLFLIILNAVAGIITVSGLGAALEIDPETGAQDRIEKSVGAADDIEPARGITDTLFSMFVSVTMTFSTIVNLMTYGTTMVINLGMPTWIVRPFEGVVYILIAADTMHMLTGRDT